MQNEIRTTTQTLDVQINIKKDNKKVRKAQNIPRGHIKTELAEAQSTTDRPHQTHMDRQTDCHRPTAKSLNHPPPPLLSSVISQSFRRTKTDGDKDGVVERLKG